jgi:hypothetical protein
MDEMPYLDAPQTRRKRRSKKWIVLLFLLLVLVIGGVAAYKFLPSVISPKQKVAPITPTPTDFVFPTDTPAPSGSLSVTPSSGPSGKVIPLPSQKTGKATPTSAASTNKSSTTVLVENGSGTAGAASKMASTLRGLGYMVTGTGNAATFDYTNVTIQVKKSKSAILSSLKKDLSASYTIDSTSTSLPESSSTDAVVIIGK